MHLKELKRLIDAAFTEYGNIPVEVIRQQGSMLVLLDGELSSVNVIFTHNVSRKPKPLLWLKLKKRR